MSIRYDDKGKYFRDVVSKDKVPSIVQTDLHLIHGHVHVHQSRRLKDELNLDEKFLAVTNCTVYDSQSGARLYQSKFLSLNRDRIVWLIPQEELIQPKSTGKSQ